MALRAYESVAERLQQQIESGSLAVGSRLRSEMQLAVELGVSRPTVREALRTLQEAGFVERASPRVMVVRSPDRAVEYHLARSLRRHDVTFADICTALALLEPALTSMAAERADPADVHELDRNLAAQERHLSHFSTWNRLDQEFHLHICELAGNPPLMIARAALTRLLLPLLDEFIASESLTAAAVVAHRRILREISAHDSETAELMARRHIDAFRQAWESAGLDMRATLRAIPSDRSEEQPLARAGV